MENAMPTGAFTCEITLQRIQGGAGTVREEKDGVTYLVSRDYELAYETLLRFTSDTELLVKAKLVGELSQQVVIRDAQGRPVRLSGYVQGRVEISDAQGRLLFRGRYYDSRTVQALAGDEALTAAGQRVTDHWENGFGEGPYAGHAFSMGAQLTREAVTPLPPLRGEGRGQID
jgi:hypothetical protein